MRKLGLHHIDGLGCTGCCMLTSDSRVIQAIGSACIMSDLRTLMGPGYEFKCLSQRIVAARVPRIASELYAALCDIKSAVNLRSNTHALRRTLEREVR